jgi:hypothetical protein
MSTLNWLVARSSIIGRVRNASASSSSQAVGNYTFQTTKSAKISGARARQTNRGKKNFSLLYLLIAIISTIFWKQMFRTDIFLQIVYMYFMILNKQSRERKSRKSRKRKRGYKIIGATVWVTCGCWYTCGNYWTCKCVCINNHGCHKEQSLAELFLPLNPAPVLSVKFVDGVESSDGRFETTHNQKSSSERDRGGPGECLRETPCKMKFPVVIIDVVNLYKVRVAR